MAQTAAPAAAGPAGALVINLSSTNSAATTLTAKLTDNLRSGVIVATPSGRGGSCPGAIGATAGGATVTYALGAVIPAVGCTLVVNVTSSVVGTYTNTIAAGALQTLAGSNALPTTATLAVTPVAAPTVGKSFTPASVLAGATSTFVLTLGNPNTRVMTLTSGITDTLPGSLRVATPNALGGTCSSASVTANAGSATLAYASGASLPPGGCTIAVSVSSLVTGTLTNLVPAGALQTSLGNSTAAASATLVVNGAAQLLISKTDGTTTLSAGSTTTYTLVVTNNGPSDASNAKVSDAPGAGLSCLVAGVTCVASGAAQCPLSYADLFGTGEPIPKIARKVTATGQ